MEKLQTISFLCRSLRLLIALLITLGVRFITFGLLAKIAIKSYSDAPNRQIYNAEEMLE